MILRLVAAATSGALLGSVFLPALPWTLVFVGLVPLLIAVHGVGVVHAGALGWLAGTVANAVGFHWVPLAVAHLQHRSWGFGLALFVPFAVWQGASVAVFAACVAWMSRRGKAGATKLAAAWVCVEWGWPMVLPWALGTALAPAAVLRQAADLGGVHLLSFGIILTSAWIVNLVSVPSRRLRALCGLGTLLGGWGGYGLWALSVYGPTAPAPVVLRAAVVQANLGADSEYIWPEGLDWWSPYETLSSAAATASSPQLIVWPETVVRAYVRDDPHWMGQLQALADRSRAALLVGTWDRSAGSTATYNAAVLVPPRAAGLSAARARGSTHPHRTGNVYHKHHLLPFGEYVPRVVRPWLPFWRTSFEFSRGAAPGALLSLETGQDGGVGLVPSICLEALLPGVMNAGVRGGAQVLVNLTDDGWFAGSVAPEQHLRAATLRAVETRRPLLRASNSGISAVIAAEGTIEQALPIGTAGVLHADIPRHEATTGYIRYGEWVVLLSMALIVWSVMLQVER